jgi:hypothetical protein
MKRYLLALIFVSAVAATLVGCGGGSSSTNNTAQGAAFITGEDTPLPSVLAFNITVNSITLSNGSTSVSVLSTPTTVDFARLVGMRALLAFSTVPAGTYTSATISFASPVISYLDTGTTPPGVGTINGSLTAATVTVPFTRSMVVSANGLTGLHLDFNLRQSLQVDALGQVTGVVDPHIVLKPVAPTDDDAQVTDLRGGFVSSNVAGNSFVIQRPGGRQITIDVNTATTFSPVGNSLATLASPAVIEVDGQVQSDGSILASTVEVVAVTHAFVAGRIINVNPSTGPAQTVTILVGEEVPDLAGIQVGLPLTLNVSSVQNYDIRLLNTWISSFLFNGSSMVVGQRIGIGGTLDTTQNPVAFVPARIVLRRQGVEGDFVQGSVVVNNAPNGGTFQIQNNGLLGYLLGAPLDVSTANSSVFVNVNGLAGLQAGGAMKLATAGLILKDTTTGKPRMYAHYIKVLQ